MMARYKVALEKVESYRPLIYGALKISRDGRVRLYDVNPHAKLRFAAYRYTTVIEPGKPPYGRYDSSNYSISMDTGREHVISFAVHRGRVVEATFGATPDINMLRRHVELVHEAGFGKWIKIALENTLWNMFHAPFGTRARLRAVRDLIYENSPKTEPYRPFGRGDRYWAIQAVIDSL